MFLKSSTALLSTPTLVLGRSMFLGIGCVLVLSMSTVGCTVETNQSSGAEARVGKKDDPNTGEPGYDTSSCKFLPSEGGAAKMENLQQTRVVVSNYYDKKYDAADLEAVAGASIDESVAYVKALGVDLHRVTEELTEKQLKELQDRQAACPAYFGLEEAPADKQAVWKDASGGLVNAGLLGLYWDDCASTNNCDDRKVLKPTILINLRTDRWTIVHEMMHYNFDKERKADRGLETKTEIFKRFDAAADKVDQLTPVYQSQPTAETALKITQQLDIVERAIFAILVRGQMEEIADEGVLVDFYYSGQFKFVPHESAENAAWYIDYAREKTLKTLRMDAVQNLLQLLNDDAATRGWTEVSASIKSILDFQDGIEKLMIQQSQDAKTKVDETRPRANTRFSGGLAVGFSSGNDPGARFREMSETQRALIEMTRYNHANLRDGFATQKMKNRLRDLAVRTGF